MLRELITRFGRHNIGVLWFVAEPMAFTLGIAALWSALKVDHGSNIPIVAFAITGYSSVLLWRNAVSRCQGGIAANSNLMYHRNVRAIDVLVTRIVLEMAGTTASFLVLTTVFVALGWANPPVDPLLVCFGWVMLAWFGSALAILISSATAFSEVIERIWHPTAYLLFPLSGAAFMVDWLPPSGREFVLMIPMVHGVEIIRDGYFGNMVRTHYDTPFLASFNLILTLAALFLLQSAARRVGEK
jgi:capsular polysaccharide transport system permease protein